LTGSGRNFCVPFEKGTGENSRKGSQTFRFAIISERHLVCTWIGMALDANDPLTPITDRIIGSAIDVHRELGPGLLESAYQACLEYDLLKKGIHFQRQVALPLTYQGVYVECGYRVDLLVDDRVIVEVKSVEAIARIHFAQMITYLKLKRCRVGLLLNFNVPSMRQGIRRVTNRSLADDLAPSDDPR
jgi:GxxExxY protein